MPVETIGYLLPILGHLGLTKFELEIHTELTRAIRLSPYVFTHSHLNTFWSHVDIYKPDRSAIWLL